jgi:hypothetical protein
MRTVRHSCCFVTSSFVRSFVCQRLPVHHTGPRMPVASRRSSHEMIVEHGHVLHCIRIGQCHCRTSEMSIADGLTQHHRISHIVGPIGPVGILLNQRLKNDTRRFVRIRRNIIIVQFKMFDERLVAHIGHHVARRFLVALSINHEIRAFVSIGTQEKRTFLDTTIARRTARSFVGKTHLEIARFKHGYRILR